MVTGKGDEDATRLELDLETDFDALFKLPLTEFTSARNALAARLRKAGLANEANRVKSLGKPPVSAWAVNQLYWKHRESFDKLMAAGERFGHAHALQLTGQTADTRKPLAARREALSSLLRFADTLLRDSGHNPTPDTIRRITTTLEALSSLRQPSEASRPGRLTEDLGPTGFDWLSTLVPGAEQAEPQKSAQTQPDPALAKAAVDTAEEALEKARSSAQELIATLKEARSRANETEKDRSEAEARLEQATLAAEEARQRLQSVSAEAERAANAIKAAEVRADEARQAMAKARKRRADESGSGSI
jgi:hypothetical protein